MVVVAQLVRAPDCGSGGRGFETHLPPYFFKSLHRMRWRLFCFHISTFAPNGTLRNTSFVYLQLVPLP